MFLDAALLQRMVKCTPSFSNKPRFFHLSRTSLKVREVSPCPLTHTDTYLTVKQLQQAHSHQNNRLTFPVTQISYSCRFAGQIGQALMKLIGAKRHLYECILNLSRDDVLWQDKNCTLLRSFSALNQLPAKTMRFYSEQVRFFIYCLIYGRTCRLPGCSQKNKCIIVIKINVTGWRRCNSVLN